jgi:glucosamine-phosphate N-acetyltransferase
MNIRQLNENDYEQYLELITQFKKTIFSEEQFIYFLNLINKNSDIWIIELNNNIIASGTILYEYKFIHDISLCAHIEDVYVDERYRGQKYGLKLVEHIINQAKNKKCYKVILDCDEKLFNQFCEFDQL